MILNVTTKTLSIAALGVSLIACGGGGGGGETQPTPSPLLAPKALGAAFVAHRLKEHALGIESKSSLSSKALIQCAEGGQMTVEKTVTADNREVRLWQIDQCRLEGRTASGRVRMISQCPDSALTDCDEVNVHYGVNGVAWSIAEEGLTQFITGRIEQTRETNKVIRRDLRRHAFEVAGVGGRSAVESDVVVTTDGNGKLSLEGEVKLDLISTACFDGRYTVFTLAPLAPGDAGFGVELRNASNDTVSATRRTSGWDVEIDGGQAVFVSDADVQSCLIG